MNDEKLVEALGAVGELSDELVKKLADLSGLGVEGLNKKTLVVSLQSATKIARRLQAAVQDFKPETRQPSYEKRDFSQAIAICIFGMLFLSSFCFYMLGKSHAETQLFAKNSNRIAGMTETVDMFVSQQAQQQKPVSVEQIRKAMADELRIQLAEEFEKLKSNLTVNVAPQPVVQQPEENSGIDPNYVPPVDDKDFIKGKCDAAISQYETMYRQMFESLNFLALDGFTNVTMFHVLENTLADSDLVPEVSSNSQQYKKLKTAIAEFSALKDVTLKRKEQYSNQDYGHIAKTHNRMLIAYNTLFEVVNAISQDFAMAQYGEDGSQYRKIGEKNILVQTEVSRYIQSLVSSASMGFAKMEE